ncbi:MAG: PTS sugar transporter subunit IIA [Planctomycetota bacterium]
MALTIGDCLSPERVCFVTGNTKHEALEELIDLLAGSAAIGDRAALAQAVWHREELMSTGIGIGIAVPHVRLKGVTKTVMAVGVHRKGLTDYASIDGKPVHIIALIAAGEGQHAEYLRLLAQVVDILKDPARRASILGQNDPKEVHRLLTSGGAR